MKKNLIKIIIFILIFLWMFKVTFSILWNYKNPINAFYKEPKNSINVAYVGGSVVYAHFNSMLSFHEYGFTTSMLSTDLQPFGAIKYLLKEAKRKQNPELYIIDITHITVENTYYNEGDIRKVTDAMEFSKNRIDAINDLLKYSNIDNDDENDNNSEINYMEYYFSFIRYHSIWKYINDLKIYNEYIHRGYLFNSSTAVIQPQTEVNWSDERAELNENTMDMLIELLQYISDNDLNVLFVIPPTPYSMIFIDVFNAGIDVINNYGYKVINFCALTEEMKIDFSGDYYNSGHLNVYGATKFTRYFSKYLKENYELPDNRNNSKYNSWLKDYDAFKNKYTIITGEDFEKLL